MNTTKVEQEARQIVRDNVKNIDTADIVEDMEGNHQRSIFLGTVFSLTPSGKYYLPFACGNVSPCPVCNGSGRAFLHKRKARVRKAAKLKHRERILCADIMSRYGPHYEGKWPRHAAERLEHLRRELDKRRVEYECPHCDGIGSREAALDDAFNEALEEEANNHGCFIQNGEGDPCDVFLCKVVEEESEEE